MACGGLHESLEVVGFREKPVLSHWISAGFFVFEPGVFDCLTGDCCCLETDVLPRLAADGQLNVALAHAVDDPGVAEGPMGPADAYLEYLPVP